MFKLLSGFFNLLSPFFLLHSVFNLSSGLLFNPESSFTKGIKFEMFTSIKKNYEKLCSEHVTNVSKK